MTHAPQAQVANYVDDMLLAVDLLRRNGLLGQSLVLMYASMDAMGLLEAAPSIQSCTRTTFKDWAHSHLIAPSQLAFTAADLYAARCGVLHSFSSESDHSRQGKAKQLHLFVLPKIDPMYEPLFAATSEIDNGTHIPVDFEDFYEAYRQALRLSQLRLDGLLKDPAYSPRVQKVLAHHTMADVGRHLTHDAEGEG